MENGRLTKTIYPEHYQLHLIPNFDDFTFAGSVVIQTKFERDASSFALHSKNLTINQLFLDSQPINYQLESSHELILINTDSLIKKGSHSLLIKFKGVLNDRMEGFYRSSYRSSTGETKFLATTQFESTEAREAFPCFDEPNFKATYDIIITSKSEHTILSNNKVKHTDDNKTSKTVYFETTPKMSSYLVAFIIGDLEYIEGKTFNDILVRFYGVPGNKEKMPFALDVAIKGLEWYIKWFEGIDYPMSKLDIIAIPDFSAGAMENWGLITFREGYLYCDEQTSSDEKKDIINVVLHELAHQWFGNLVTMEWWTYLWLNESMATYFAWMVTNELYPEYHIWNKFIEDEYESALDLDSLESSHPIEVTVKNTNDIQNIFDAISYSKGSCLVRYLASYLGPDNFRKGMNLYMNNNLYKNTTSTDLWKAFDEVSNSDIGKLMNSWTKQTGYPVVTVNCDGFTLHLNQQRFFKNGRNPSNKQLWTIPLEILYQDENDVERRLTVTFDTEDQLIPMTKSIKSIRSINPDRTSFVRVCYNTSPKISEVNNLTYMLDDAFSLALSGYSDFMKPFHILSTLELENFDDNSLWNVLTSYVLAMVELTENDKHIEQKLRASLSYLCSYLKNILNKIGYEVNPSEDQNTTDIRDLALSVLSKSDDQTVIDYCLQLFRNNNWYSKKYLACKVVGKHGTKEEYYKLLEMYESSTNSQLKDALENGLTKTEDPVLINNNLSLIFSGIIRNQDILTFMRGLMTNYKSREVTRLFIYDNWQTFLNKYSVGSSELLKLIKILGMGISSNDELYKFRNFLKIRPDGSDAAVDQTLEKITGRLFMINRIKTDPLFTYDKDSRN
jgi:aminopeptidase 2